MAVILISDYSIFSQQMTLSIRKETSRPSNQINKVFPYDIQLSDADGNTINSSNLLGKNNKATVLLFWLTTCGPCRMELKAISSKFKEWKKEKDFEFYAISMDFPERNEQFRKRVKESNWPFAAYNDANGEFRYVMEGGLNGLPQVFLLDKKGQVIYHHRKYRPGDEDKLFEAIKKIY